MNFDLHLWQVARVTVLSHGGLISTFFFLFLMISKRERKRENKMREKMKRGKWGEWGVTGGERERENIK
jgi:hypothetical protein